MAQPITSTEREIVAAGRALLAAGYSVTGNTLRRQLGQRGAPKRLEAVWERASGAPVKRPRATGQHASNAKLSRLRLRLADTQRRAEAAETLARERGILLGLEGG